MNMIVLEQHILDLCCVYEVGLDKIGYKECLFINNFNLPPGYNYSAIRILLTLPNNYPVAAPGVGGSRVFVPISLRFKGRQPTDFHPGVAPIDNLKKEVAWWCYESVSWQPCKDNLITFTELLRAHMTNPPVK